MTVIAESLTALILSATWFVSDHGFKLSFGPSLFELLASWFLGDLGFSALEAFRTPAVHRLRTGLAVRQSRGGKQGCQELMESLVAQGRALCAPAVRCISLVPPAGKTSEKLPFNLNRKNLTTAS